ncbi:MAG: hybrid sensor histidine kinase/response regulator [Alphaproteobacteria bacterium]|jgi:signal transduction histidine kinase/CheY-like chemotaxis protein|nr:hybrid sensor histidine kinase/response regulator [Alphaproteobacteria bacterium]MDP6568019.1 hybrid sensor histidine kinase/response regulator [Alphaproteobacteria bacterium]MDP6813486.1 hybrid sensor histidine kinase/response regulator [Alphaproteobacteria bacterium]
MHHEVGDGAAVSDDVVLRGLLTILERQLPAAQIGSVVAGCLLVLGLWDDHLRFALGVWLAVLLGATALRYPIYKRFPVAGLRDDQLPLYARLFTLSTGLSGLIWGLGVLAFLGQIDLFRFAFIAAIYTGMAAATLGSLSAFLPAYLAFVLPALLPAAAAMLILGTPTFQIVGGGALFYLFLVISAARTLNRYIVDSVRLRHERLALVDRLSAEKAKAEESERAKSRFLAAASHDLRQPLNALRLFVDALKASREPEQRDHLHERIGQSTDALNAIIDGVLDLSKIESGTLRPNVASVAAADILHTIQADFALLATDKGISLRVAPSAGVILTDPEMLLRIVRNLVSNAIRYTERGGVLVGCRPAGSGFRIEVVDSGAGITPEQQSRIFEEFYQVDNRERDRARGLGLGLAIVKGLCDLLGHHLSVRSQPGHGTTFRVEVPAGSEDQLRPPPPSQAAALLDVPRAVLIIDDDRLSLDAMDNLIASWGHLTATATSIGAARETVGESFHPEILVTDFRLQDGQTGIDAVRVLRDTVGAEIPAIIVSGDTDPKRLREADASGLPLLHKPVNPAKLRALLNALGADRTEVD